MFDRTAAVTLSAFGDGIVPSGFVKRKKHAILVGHLPRFDDQTVCIALHAIYGHAGSDIFATAVISQEPLHVFQYVVRRLHFGAVTEAFAVRCAPPHISLDADPFDPALEHFDRVIGT